MPHNKSLPIALFLLVLAASCTDNSPQPSNLQLPNYEPDNNPDSQLPPPGSNPNDVKYRWDVPGGAAEIISGCLGTDCIPSLTDPEMTDVASAVQLQDNDLVLGLVYRGEARAYPLRILDWHEIINQTFPDGSIVSVTYCPLTGTGVAIDVSRTGVLNAEMGLLSFGVSGLLYNGNLIPYDRGTFSNWSQMLLRCVNGPLRGTRMITLPLIETSWETWQTMFPNSKVVSDNTGFDRPYDIFPYGAYRTDPFLLFPIREDDTRLPRKQRVHGIVTDRFVPRGKTYPFSLFAAPRAINDMAEGEPVVVAGMQEADLYLSYSRRAADGSVLTFEVDTSSPAIYPLDLMDQEGTRWNILGEAIDGPRKGEKLVATASYNGYWFAWGAFFPGVPIYAD